MSINNDMNAYPHAGRAIETADEFENAACADKLHSIMTNLEVKGGIKLCENLTSVNGRIWYRNGNSDLDLLVDSHLVRGVSLPAIDSEDIPSGMGEDDHVGWKLVISTPDGDDAGVSDDTFAVDTFFELGVVDLEDREKQLVVIPRYILGSGSASGAQGTRVKKEADGSDHDPYGEEEHIKFFYASSPHKLKLKPVWNDGSSEIVGDAIQTASVEFFMKAARMTDTGVLVSYEKVSPIGDLFNGIVSADNEVDSIIDLAKEIATDVNVIDAFVASIADRANARIVDWAAELNDGSGTHVTMTHNFSQLTASMRSALSSLSSTIASSEGRISAEIQRLDQLLLTTSLRIEEHGKFKTPASDGGSDCDTYEIFVDGLHAKHMVKASDWMVKAYVETEGSQPTMKQVTIPFKVEIVDEASAGCSLVPSEADLSRYQDSLGLTPKERIARIIAVINALEVGADVELYKKKWDQHVGLRELVNAAQVNMLEGRITSLKPFFVESAQSTHLLTEILIAKKHVGILPIFSISEDESTGKRDISLEGWKSSAEKINKRLKITFDRNECSELGSTEMVSFRGVFTGQEESDQDNYSYEIDNFFAITGFKQLFAANVVTATHSFKNAFEQLASMSNLRDEGTDKCYADDVADIDDLYSQVLTPGANWNFGYSTAQSFGEELPANTTTVAHSYIDSSEPTKLVKFKVGEVYGDGSFYQQMAAGKGLDYNWNLAGWPQLDSDGNYVYDEDGNQVYAYPNADMEDYVGMSWEDTMQLLTAALTVEVREGSLPMVDGKLDMAAWQSLPLVATETSWSVLDSSTGEELYQTGLLFNQREFQVEMTYGQEYSWVLLDDTGKQLMEDSLESSLHITWGQGPQNAPFPQVQMHYTYPKLKDVVATAYEAYGEEIVVKMVHDHITDGEIEQDLWSGTSFEENGPFKAMGNIKIQDNIASVCADPLLWDTASDVQPGLSEDDEGNITFGQSDCGEQSQFAMLESLSPSELATLLAPQEMPADIDGVFEYSDEAHADFLANLEYLDSMVAKVASAIEGGQGMISNPLVTVDLKWRTLDSEDLGAYPIMNSGAALSQGYGEDIPVLVAILDNSNGAVELQHLEVGMLRHSSPTTDPEAVVEGMYVEMVNVPAPSQTQECLIIEAFSFMPMPEESKMGDEEGKEGDKANPATELARGIYEAAHVTALSDSYVQSDGYSIDVVDDLQGSDLDAESDQDAVGAWKDNVTVVVDHYSLGSVEIGYSNFPSIRAGRDNLAEAICSAEGDILGAQEELYTSDGETPSLASLLGNLKFSELDGHPAESEARSMRDYLMKSASEAIRGLEGESVYQFFHIGFDQLPIGNYFNDRISVYEDDIESLEADLSELEVLIKLCDDGQLEGCDPSALIAELEQKNQDVKTLLDQMKVLKEERHDVETRIQDFAKDMRDYRELMTKQFSDDPSMTIQSTLAAFIGQFLVRRVQLEAAVASITGESGMELPEVSGLIDVHVPILHMELALFSSLHRDDTIPAVQALEEFMGMATKMIESMKVGYPLDCDNLKLYGA